METRARGPWGLGWPTRRGGLASIAVGALLLILLACARAQVGDPSDWRDVLSTASFDVFIVGVLGGFCLFAVAGGLFLGFALFLLVLTCLDAMLPGLRLRRWLPSCATDGPSPPRPLPPGVRDGQRFRAPDGGLYRLHQGLACDEMHELSPVDQPRTGGRPRRCRVEVVFRGGRDEFSPPRVYHHFSRLMIDESGAIHWRFQVDRRERTLRERLVPAGWTVADLVPVDALASD